MQKHTKSYDLSENMKRLNFIVSLAQTLDFFYTPTIHCIDSDIETEIDNSFHAISSLIEAFGENLSF